MQRRWLGSVLKPHTLPVISYQTPDQSHTTQERTIYAAPFNVGLSHELIQFQPKSNVLRPLTENQQQLLDLMVAGHNVYFTGKAGTGKTEVIRHFVQHLKDCKKSFAVTAPTGAAASLLDGQTFHSFSSLLLPTISQNVDYIKRNEKRLERYLKTQVLILDEASMIQPDFLDMFNDVCRLLRGNPLPFGGIQVVLSGDFFQLPPVTKGLISQRKEDSRMISLAESSLLSYYQMKQLPIDHHRAYSSPLDTDTRYAFESQCWRQMEAHGLKKVVLQQAFRQDDPEFVALLDDIRHGICSTSMWEYLDPLRKKHKSWKGKVKPILLSGFRRTAETCNSKELQKILKPVVSFQSIDSVHTEEASNWHMYNDDKQFVNRDFDQLQPDALLHLKIGAQVILIRNLSVKKKLVNGSKGVVVDFKTTFDNVLDRHVELPVVHFASGDSFVIGYHEFVSWIGVQGIGSGLRLRRCQIPLKLGWGITIHKSQGMTLDRAILDLPTAFAPGHAYVAMSRVRNKEGLSIKKFSEDSIFVSEKVKQFYAAFEKPEAVQQLSLEQ